VVTVAMLILGVLAMLVVSLRMSYAEDKRPVAVRTWMAIDNTASDNTAGR